MELSAIKIVFLLAVLAAAVLGGAVPLRQHPGEPGARFLGLGNALAAGIFLGAGFVHMLPDAHRGFEALGSGYPWAFLLAATAIVFLLLVEHVLVSDRAHEMVHAPAGEAFVELGSGSRGAVGAYAVLAALSVHSLVAGLALGAQRELGDALVIFLAILAHKTMAGFALGVSLVRNPMPRRRAWRLLGVFALATPVGIGVGAMLEVGLHGDARGLLEASFLALAGGTFAYVATLDILRDELLEPAGRFPKWLLVAAGTAAMALLAVWV